MPNCKPATFFSIPTPYEIKEGGMFLVTSRRTMDHPDIVGIEKSESEENLSQKPPENENRE